MKIKKILLLGFEEKELEDLLFDKKIIRHSCFSINNVEDSIKMYSQVMTQLQLVDGVFFDDIIKYIHLGIQFKGVDGFTSPFKLIDNLNKLIDNKNGQILVIQKEVPPEHYLDYLYSRIKNKKIIKEAIGIKKYL